MSDVSKKELSYHIVNFAKKNGRDATPAEKRCIEAAILGIEPGVMKAVKAELAGDIDTLAKCSAREMMVAHCFLKDLEEATKIPLLAGQIAVAGHIKRRLEDVIKPYVNQKVTDEKELLTVLNDVVSDELFLMGMRHLYPNIWIADDGELKIEILIKETA